MTKHFSLIFWGILAMAFILSLTGYGAYALIGLITINIVIGLTILQMLSDKKEVKDND